MVPSITIKEKKWLNALISIRNPILNIKSNKLVQFRINTHSTFQNDKYIVFVNLLLIVFYSLMEIFNSNSFFFCILVFISFWFNSILFRLFVSNFKYILIHNLLCEQKLIRYRFYGNLLNKNKLLNYIFYHKKSKYIFLCY